MKVCCYDCGKTDVKMVERPRTIRSGLKNTVDVCKDCRMAWYKKHDLFLSRYNFECPQCGHEQSAAPSMAMQQNLNQGHGSCMKCDTFLHLEIVGDKYEGKMQAILWDEYLKSKDADAN